MADLKTIYIVAGGTGGHVFPAKRVAQKYLNNGFKINWIGTSRGPEKKICKDLGINFIQVPLYGFRGKGFFTKLKALIAFILSGLIFIFYSNPFNKQNSPMLVFGGYVSLIAFFYFKGPVFLQEQNTIPGSVSRLLLSTNKVSKIFCGFEKTKNFFEKYEKNFIDLINTGNPVGKIKEKENSLNNSSCLKVLVLGGSQGSMFLNELIPETFKEFTENNSLEVKHQSGYKNETKVKDNYSTFIGEVTVQAFIEDIESAYQWADIIICRSGALTVSEIIASRSVGVFVPIKVSIDDHQKENASYLSSLDAAWLIEESENFKNELRELLVEIINNKNLIYEKRENIKKIELKDAESIIFNEINAWYK
ncbi:MAG: UDP-N-acetylglucosamine--N-acetylmuramyl-(pentapeptide) pyrophosphoryl-undecaprenol N-acetylglucosamine transferase [Pseudomonadota bacterium]|nr:UDP-N-acetylglucosamine--N-acetylmuramyl-(pentapeptide) pyrophosphoryl-undecaprenol N-acetylglucosamine transferase [Pseudomonadota bacterium]